MKNSPDSTPSREPAAGSPPKAPAPSAPLALRAFLVQGLVVLGLFAALLLSLPSCAQPPAKGQPTPSRTPRRVYNPLTERWEPAPPNGPRFNE